MAYVVIQYDRPTDTQHWNHYNQRVRDWITQLLQIPGAVSFMAYRTLDEASPDTITMLEFGTIEDARKAQSSELMKTVLEELRQIAGRVGIVLVERSPFTPEPIPA